MTESDIPAVQKFVKDVNEVIRQNEMLQKWVIEVMLEYLKTH